MTEDFSVQALSIYNCRKFN